MDTETRQALNSLLTARQERALHELDADPAYRAVCSRQNALESQLDALFSRFSKEENAVIRRHADGENEKASFEQEALYIQGIRDCFRLCLSLTV